MKNINAKVREIMQEVEKEIEIGLDVQTATTLKKWAKELGVKNWWLKKKIDLIIDIKAIFKEIQAEVNKVDEPTPTTEKVNKIKLTPKEIKLLNAMRTNEYGDALQEGSTWSFTAIDNSGVEAKQARGVISSLVKKGLILVSPAENKDDHECLEFTKEGKKLFDNADGKENDGWGGPKLLKEATEKKSKTTKKEQPEEEAIYYGITELSLELGITSKKARWIIRKDGSITKQDTRWRWAIDNKKDMESYKQVKEILTKYVNTHKFGKK